MKKRLHHVFLILALFAGLHKTTAQGTAFTYQGQLTDNGAPATGIYDLRFTVYDALNAGNPVGSVMDANDLGVTNGLFTVTLDPGAGVFPGAARWLSIGVRPGASVGAYTNVTPRQALTATPYAFKALNADTATTATTANLANNVAAGAVGSAQLAPGAAATNLG